jgi:alpha-1,2-mannosyltransferase
MVWAIGLLAFAMRLASLVNGGSFDALMGYDEGVYFSSANGLVAGLMPYRDFVMVHPPGILLILSPFAALGKLVGDPTAWTVARLFVMLVGAANAMMITIVGRRVGTWAGLTAGLLYAVWTPAIHVERTTMLEAFVLAGMLVALVALRTPRVSTTRLVLAGAALGAAYSVKLWGAVPLLVIVGWLLVSRAWRSSVVVGASALGVIALICGPFFALAPHRMFDLVISAQMNRGRAGSTTSGRLDRILNLADVDPSIATHGSVWLTIGLALALGLLSALAWRIPRARLWVALLAAQVAVLMVVPVYFAGYSSFAGPALMLVIGAAVEVVRRWAGRRSPRTRTTVVAALAVGAGAAIVASTVMTLQPQARDFGKPERIEAFTAGARCVGSDSPGMLLLTNTLSRDLARGCPVIFDVDGSVYDVNSGKNPQRLTSTQRRLASPAYQETLMRYFDASDVLLLHRVEADGLSPQTLAKLAQRPVLWEHGNTKVLGSN